MADTDIAGTDDLSAEDDLFGTLLGTEDTSDGTGSDTTAGDKGTSQDTLIDPATLPDALKPHWSNMTRAYNAKLTELRAEQAEVDTLREKARTFDRFQDDPAFATKTIEDYLARTGRALPSGNAMTPAAGTTSTAGVPDHILKAVTESLADNPDMAFMAPVIAKAAWAVAQQANAPLHQANAETEKTRIAREYQEMEAALSASTPGWEEHEKEMSARVSFLRSALTGKGPMAHPKYGSVLQLVHDWVAGPGHATAVAGQRMKKAVLNQTTTGNGQKAPAPNLQEQIGKADSYQEKVKLAFRAAVTEARQ